MTSDQEQLELIRRHMDGTATAEDLRALQTALRADAAFRRIFARYANLDAALGHGRPALAPMPEVKAAVRPHAVFSWLQWRPLAAAAMFVAVLGLAAMWMMRTPAASLSEVSGDVRVWRAQRTMKVANGFALQAGDWLLTGDDGAAAVTFPGETTRLSIGATAEFGVVAAKPGKELKLTAGTLTASVARQSASHPMMIRTPTAKAEVLGTKFVMSANKVTTEMRVDEGRVLIAREDDENGVVVEATQVATVMATAPVSVVAPPPSQSLQSALLAHWKLDGDGADSSGNGLDLTLGTGVIFSEGRIGKALDFHSANMDAESPRLALPPVFTVSLWLRLNRGEARAQPLLGFDGQQAGVDDFWVTLLPAFPGSGLVLDVRGREMGARAMSTVGVVRVEKWHHLVVSVDAVQGRATFLVDGRDVTAVAGLRRDFKLTGALLIGHRVKGGPLPFDGQLDDIRIYGRALTALEISALAD